MFIIDLIVIAGVIAGLQVVIFKRYVLRNLHYVRRFKVKHCFRGDEIELVEQLSNKKRLPVPWLRVESQLSTHLHFSKQDNFDVSSGQVYQNHRSLFSLGGYMKLTRTNRITPNRRGWYKLSTVSLTSGDLFGNISCHIQIPLEDELIVYPKPAVVPFEQLPSQSLQGEQQVKRFIIPDPFVIVGARNYQSGDSMKQVNWKATARAGTLQVHQYDFTADRSLMILLNVDDKEGMWRNVTNEAVIEQGIEWAAGAAEAAISRGMDVGFTANMPMSGNSDHIHIEPGRGQEHLFMLYELMAKLVIERTSLFMDLLMLEALKRYSNRDIVIITSYWSDSLELAANSLMQNGNTVSIWYLPEAVQKDTFKSEVTVNDRGRYVS
ncbi:DUF58 domain-containing protein [Paenibacillus sp. GSMTC-2017]|uniref:DUF58 domain-containing protein n=1 Tax=Paenibacillus sp. GSMTC-2017 TaxID=2794350 RepID=UPI0018D9F54E|nr:DUF58 domain-containing protein [Paenibacillus sp. GSMTC-2017]MBH5317731.1 DUF58 domain-containing protein [Paenibacillus sp. GSMTC-2017]